MPHDTKAHMTLPMLRRLLPVAILLLGLALFLLFGLERYFSFEMLSRHHAELAAWVAGHVALAALIFVLFYALVVAFSLPIAVVITPVGGFLFGVWLGALLSVIGATLGSVALFLAARTAFYDLFRARAGATLARLEDGFRRDSFNYLLFLRLVPVFPFWLVNIVPALLGMQLGPYALATLIGIVPGAIVYAERRRELRHADRARRAPGSRRDLRMAHPVAAAGPGRAVAAAGDLHPPARRQGGTLR